MKAAARKVEISQQREYIILPRMILASQYLQCPEEQQQMTTTVLDGKMEDQKIIGDYQ